ncbi:MAG: SGNH/GDSL hydrolase family protein [Pirellulales bacterium]
MRAALLLVAVVAVVPSTLHAAPLRVMALGDSNTHGNGAYPTLLQNDLDQQFGTGQFTVINHGINGQTANQMAVDMVKMGWLNEDPDVALVMIGGNDLATFTGITTPAGLIAALDQTVAEVQQIVDLLKGHQNADGQSPRVIVSAYPPNLLTDVIVSGLPINPNVVVNLFNDQMQSSLTGVDWFFDDNWLDILNPNTWRARPELLRDSVHMNQAGRQILADNFREALLLVVPEPGSLVLALTAAIWVALAVIGRREARPKAR